MNKVTIGILAHVDAGKTTLSEALLYDTGTIRSLGRVDHQDTFLDTDPVERRRGITVYSKTARFSYGTNPHEEKEFILLDTPGHADFTAEMERTLGVLDYAILVISGSDGVQSHTRTLWKLLEAYGIPCYLFVNKMDISFRSSGDLMRELKEQLSEYCMDFTGYYDAAHPWSHQDMETMALCREELMEHYLQTGQLDHAMLQQAIRERELFPVLFGSALKLEGVENLLDAMARWMLPTRSGGQAFGARCYKIGRDKNGNRLTWLKITAGTLGMKDVISYRTQQQALAEKVDQIRIYQGEGFAVAEEVSAGEICAVCGLTKTEPGMGLGTEPPGEYAVSEPVLSYQILPPAEVSPHRLLEYMKQLEEEDPTLHVMWREAVGQVYINLMGPVQTEVLQQQIKDRFGVAVTFGQGQVRYKETIEGTAEGVGHFEPLRHYAEAHIRLEALPRGSGMEYAIDCPADMLDTNWQRLMYTHLTERIHKGVLTGAPLTDVRLTVVGGRAHKKHTEGGDFRQATYRAVRQGLRKAKSILLEPYYQVALEVPSQLVGRAMTDMNRMQGQITPPEQVGETAILKGKAPVSLLRNYGTELAAYTGGRGRMELSPAGYFPCHDAQQVIAEIGYDADLDTENPCDSVFCAHGAGYVVPWYQVQDYMHVPLQTDLQEASQEDALLAAKAAAWQRRQEAAGQPQGRSGSGVGGLEPELEEIFVREFGEIRRRLPSQEKQSRSYDKQQRIASARQAYLDAHEKEEKTRPKEQKRFLLVDGYNVIFAWQELDAIARDSLDGARGRLMDIMCNYQAHIGEELILVFDAYRIQGHKEEIIDYHNIHVVYTREAETADAYIERTTHVMAKDYQVTVATSDRLEQMIVMGDGARRISARELEKEVQRVNEEALKAYRDRLRERK